MRLFSIDGEPGSGKTTLLHRLVSDQKYDQMVVQDRRLRSLAEIFVENDKSGGFTQFLLKMASYSCNFSLLDIHEKETLVTNEFMVPIRSENQQDHLLEIEILECLLKRYNISLEVIYLHVPYLERERRRLHRSAKDYRLTIKNVDIEHKNVEKAVEADKYYANYWQEVIPSLVSFPIHFLDGNRDVDLVFVDVLSLVEKGILER